MEMTAEDTRVRPRRSDIWCGGKKPRDTEQTPSHRWKLSTFPSWALSIPSESPPRLLTCAHSPPLARNPSAPERPVGAAPPAAAASASALPRAAAPCTPRSGFRAPATKAVRRARGDRPSASERGPHGLGPLRALTRGGAEDGVGSGLAPAPALATQTRWRSHPRSAFLALQEKSAAALPGAGRVSAARQRGAPAGQRRALAPGWRPLTSPPPRARAPESPQPLTWPWRGARAGPGGGPRLGRARLPTPSQGPSAALRSLGPPSSEVLAPPVAGVSLAGALAARSVPRGGARRRLPRPEADSSGAAPPVSPESPRTPALPSPPPPPPPPGFSASCSLREWPLGLPCPPRLSWAHIVLPTLSLDSPPIEWRLDSTVFTPPFPNSLAQMMGVATVGCGGWCCGGGLLEGRLPPSAADTRSQEKFSRGFCVHSACSRLITQLLSLPRGRRLRDHKRELGLGNGGSKPLGLLHEEGRAGAGRGQHQTTPELRARANFCTSWLSTPSRSRTGRALREAAGSPWFVPSLPDQKGYCVPRAATSRGRCRIKRSRVMLRASSDRFSSTFHS